MNLEPLFCPFCGRPAETESTVTQETVRCTLCPATMSHDGSLVALITMWNNRVVKDCFTTDHAEIAQLRARVAELGKIIIECERELDIHCVCPYCSRDYMGDNHHPGCALAAVVKDCLTTDKENL